MVKARQDMVMRGDCIDAMRQLDDASVDMILLTLLIICNWGNLS